MIIVQEAALGVGLTTIAVFPVLIAALQGLIGFPLTSIILRKEAARLKGEYRAGKLARPRSSEEGPAGQALLPAVSGTRRAPCSSSAWWCCLASASTT